MSKLQCIQTCVPQGSVLGRLLLSIFIKDLPNSTRSKTIPFADDVALIRHTNNFSQLQSMTENG